MSPDSGVYYFYKTSKQNDLIEWRAGIVVSCEPHFKRILTHSGRKTSSAYKGTHLKPTNALAQELSRGYMEDYSYDTSLEENEIVT